jgi:hypothetical protein
MENRYVEARRRAVWQIIKSRVPDAEKARAFGELAEREIGRAFWRGAQHALRKPSARQAGKLRPVPSAPVRPLVRKDVEVDDVGEEV